MNHIEGWQPAAKGAPVSDAIREPCVDVVIAAWNSARTIGKAIESVLSDPAVCSVAVIDDASADRTLEAAKASDDCSGRLILRRLETNRGPAAARNAGISISNAPWIAVVDADDYVISGRFTRLVALAGGCDFVADDIGQFVEGSADGPQPLLSQEPFTAWTCDFETFVRGNVSAPGRLRKELGFLKPLMRRDFLTEHGLKYDERLRLGEDYAIYARALALGARFLVVPSQGYVSLIRDNSLSAHHLKADLERLRDSDLELLEMRDFARGERGAILKHYHSIDARVQWLTVIEAVKSRNPVRFLQATLRSKETALFVSARLCEQLVARSLKYMAIQ